MLLTGLSSLQWPILIIPIALHPSAQNPYTVLPGLAHKHLCLLVQKASPHPIDTIPLLLVSIWLTCLRKQYGLVSCAGTVHANAPALAFLGRRPAFLLVYSMQQGSPPACCVVLSNKGVSRMNITEIVRTLTPL